MKQVILMRHAKSSWAEPAMDDFDRPLNDRGMNDVVRSARRLGDFLGKEQALLESSSAVRAKLTSQQVLDQCAEQITDVSWNEDLYLCSPETWLDIVRSWNNNRDHGISVGHNPTITSMINRLCMAGIDNVPTSGIAGITFDVNTWKEVGWGQGKLVWFDYPKMHAAA